ncbi:hypothetical protein PRUB_b0594 [Pseudoalteromonas rubra]|uniref:ADP-ribosylglycohydrolase n=1 Tax=Pseudoalteromonas rubra TaxID=43658 RepID=A0A8T0BZQ4_9GAMM|nr:ADP-ribosylglycohydrolase family protein [Pseudoalteromonas rubra]KAF7781393.1 hypothetical protein PRUB_b0594 [Pseudoalteromonas rubra]
MLVEMAIADAYGAGFEFVEQDIIRAHNDLGGYRAHALSGESACYTDDTQMSLALAELMLSDKVWDCETIAAAFYDTYHRDPVHGYAKRLQQAFAQASDAQEFARQVKTDSFGNGAMMRALPLGYLADEQAIMDKAEQQARVTHDHDIAVNAAKCIALATHAGIYKKASLETLPDYLTGFGCVFETHWEGPVRAISEDTLSAVLMVLSQARSLSKILELSVNLGGDTDSVAAISCGIASCYEEVEKDLPQALIAQFDHPHYGLEYLANIDLRLEALKRTDKL